MINEYRAINGIRTESGNGKKTIKGRTELKWNEIC
jgi:hypothetical protein